MTAYLPWLLLLLACPLMMIVMMRSMGGGKNTDRTTRQANSTGRVQHPDGTLSGSAQSETGAGDDRNGERIAHLEREVADLRAAREHPPGRHPTPRR